MANPYRPILEYIPLFLEYCDLERGLSIHTQINYQRYLKKFEKWLIQEEKKALKPHALTIQDVHEFRKFLSKINDENGVRLSPISQNYYLIALRALLSYFLEKGISSLPPNKIKLWKTSKKSSKFLTREQVDKLLNAPDVAHISGLRDRAVLELIFATGLRISEVVALNRNSFYHVIDKENGQVEIVSRGKRIRKIHIPKGALDWIKEYLAARTDHQEALFINYRGRVQTENRLTPRSIERIIKAYAIKAGVPEFTTPNALRHSYTQDLIKTSAGIPHIKQALGHENILTTQTYIHRQFHSGKNLK